MNRILPCFISVVLISHCSFGQVGEIKRSSGGGSKRNVDVGGSGTSGSGGGSMAVFFAQLFFEEGIEMQQRKLQRRQEVPSMVSLDVMLQCAVQPSSYYIVNPRIRGNWGLFSTDFRFNYIIEEELDGVKVLQTNDWQILQLNLVTTRDVKFSVGGGMIYEAFGEKNNYSEWTTAVQVMPFNSRIGGMAEYRGSEARKEINGQARYILREKGRLHWSLTMGAVYQRYYGQVTTWGIQGGLMLSVY